jgi:hypothetical protein
MFTSASAGIPKTIDSRLEWVTMQQFVEHVGKVLKFDMQIQLFLNWRV